MKTILLNPFKFSGKIVNPVWFRAVREFQSLNDNERDNFCSRCGCTGGCNLCSDISKFNVEGLSLYN